MLSGVHGMFPRSLYARARSGVVHGRATLSGDNVDEAKENTPGEIIRAIIYNRGRTMKEVAQTVGSNKSSFSSYICGKNVPSIAMCRRLALALEMTAAEKANLLSACHFSVINMWMRGEKVL